MISIHYRANSPIRFISTSDVALRKLLRRAGVEDDVRLLEQPPSGGHSTEASLMSSTYNPLYSADALHRKLGYTSEHVALAGPLNGTVDVVPESRLAPVKGHLRAVCPPRRSLVCHFAGRPQ